MEAEAGAVSVRGRIPVLGTTYDSRIRGFRSMDLLDWDQSFAVLFQFVLTLFFFLSFPYPSYRKMF